MPRAGGAGGAAGPKKKAKETKEAKLKILTHLDDLYSVGGTLPFIGCGDANQVPKAEMNSTSGRRARCGARSSRWHARQETTSRLPLLSRATAPLRIRRSSMGGRASQM